MSEPTKCPFCGRNQGRSIGTTIMWECGTLEHPVGSQVRSLFCWESERKALKARIARLEETLRGGEKVIAKLSYNRTERTFKSTKP